MDCGAKETQVKVKKWRLLILERAIDDIQDAIEYYNARQKGLGQKFYKSVNKTINELQKHPHYQIRYANIRCLLVKKFPYMIHFSLDADAGTVLIHAVVHTSLNPDKHWLNDN
jgi:plasmid stabilization system protein ParE